jgi:2-amino-4-hydroxy-6-hydroxymethyldihydropteridine diphosphokinase
VKIRTERGTAGEAPEKQWVVVALGSNLGDSAGIVREAMERLKARAQGMMLTSSLWQTAPVDCPPGSADFVNAVVAWERTPEETPEKLLAELQAMEREFGRRPGKQRNEARNLDLDLIVCGGEIRDERDLILPHPRAAGRAFVLCPLAEVLPELVLPGQQRTVRELRDRVGAEERSALRMEPQSGVCVRCGVKTENRLGDTWICESCYEARSSCCPEFGVDDLTEPDQNVSP